MAQKTPDITLYTAQTPNGIKISILLEELGLPYKTVAIDLGRNEQKQPWFLAINPNGRIPALTDGTLHVFESGAILQYLVETYDTERKLSFEHGSPEYWEVQSWLFFQNAGVGPMQGQANHFFRYAPEKIPYGINRYQEETRRLYGVLDTQLGVTGDYLVKGKMTIADIATYGWVRAAGWAGIEIDGFPALKAWEERLEVREGVRKGRDVPSVNRIKELAEDKEKSEREAEKARRWIMGEGKEEKGKEEKGKEKGKEE